MLRSRREPSNRERQFLAWVLLVTVVPSSSFLFPSRYRCISAHLLHAEKKPSGGSDLGPFGGLPNPFEAVSSLFKPKEPEPKSELEEFIDESVKGLGPMGGLIGAGMKSLAKGVAGAMEEQKKDIDLVSDATERQLRMDNAASNALGDNIRLGMPFSQMSSQVGPTKTIEMQMPAAGSLGQGSVAVSAEAREGQEVELKRLQLQTPRGQVLEIDVTEMGRGDLPIEGKIRTDDDGSQTDGFVDVEIL